MGQQIGRKHGDCTALGCLILYCSRLVKCFGRILVPKFREKYFWNIFCFEGLVQREKILEYLREKVIMTFIFVLKYKGCALSCVYSTLYS